ncbi:MAG: CHAD domain-containing protein [Pirellulales bacterium]|jgi:CHAD domain-containing protein
MINKQTEGHRAGLINSTEDKSNSWDGIRLDQDGDFPSFRNNLFSMDHRASDVVTTTLQTLLNAVWKACTAASEPAASPETVRRLRVTSRRTLVALSVFSPLLPKAIVSSFKQHLRDLRQAAGATRDYDVLSDRLHQHIPPTSGLHTAHDLSLDQILNLVAKQQNENRKSIYAVHSELLSWNWQLRVATIKSHVQPKKMAYLKFVRNQMKKLRTKFSKVADSTKKTPAQLHRLRIAGKKLRYALELVPEEHMNTSLQKCRASLQKIQKKLGNFTDHTAASEILKQFSKEPLADDMLFVIHKMQQEEHELATLSCRQFFGWWTGKRRRSMYKRLEKGLDDD